MCERPELRPLAPKMGALLRKICASCDAGQLTTVGDLPGAEKDTAARLRRAPRWSRISRLVRQSG